MNWISVENGLPRDKTDVLVVLDLGKPEYEYVMSAYFGGGYWWHPSCACGEIDSSRITHWMPHPPLPEPPKAES
jgi:hypothetical protein